MELGTLLDAWIIYEAPHEYEDLDYAGFEYCQGNGQYVDYERLWDIEAEMQLEQQKTKELSMLETWKKNVADWKE